MDNKQKLEKILGRGIISEYLPSYEEFIKSALTKKLRIYIGIDATGDTLHLSHAKNFMFLEELRLLGHEVIVLFGDFTARLGDPSDRSAARVQLSQEEVDSNVKSWIEQIKPLMDFEATENPPQIKYNSTWLKDMTLEDLMELAPNFTVQQMIERDMYQKRIKEEKPIYLHEFLYPLMQGYDSVAMDVDVEFCGTDQIFNAMAGRTLQKRINNKEKFVIAANLMEDPETGLLMSKSKNIGVFLNTTAEEMFREIMAQPDSMTKILLINNTRIELDEIEQIVSGGPLEAKLKTAHEITKIIHGQTSADSARDEFNRKIRDKTLTDHDFVEIEFHGGESLKDVLLNAKIVESGSDFFRLINGGAIKSIENDVAISDTNEPAQPGKYKIGKKRLIQLKKSAS